MPGNSLKAPLEPPRIVSIEAPDQVEEGTEVQLRWILGGGAATQITLNGKKVTGTSIKVKPLSDPTIYTLAVTNKAGTVVAEKAVGTHATGDVVSTHMDLPGDEPAPRITDHNHPYRADSADKSEMIRVRSNLAALGAGLFQITGMPNAHNPAHLAERLKAIKLGHTPEDTLTLINAEHDRERTAIMWNHLGVLVHGGAIQEGHAFRVSTGEKAEVARVRANLGRLSHEFSKIPGFHGANLAELDSKLKTLKAGGKEAAARFNAELDRVRAEVFDKRPKAPASPGAQPAHHHKTHPYRASSVAHAEIDRVLKNLRILAEGLHKVTNLGNKHDPAKLSAKVKGIPPKATHEHTLDMINHWLDHERTKLIGHHASYLHQGAGPGAKVNEKTHPYRVSSPNPAEIIRVRRNLHAMGLGLEKIPGFGKRFDFTEHDKRINAVKPGANDAETVARYNAEFDWERAHMMQLHPSPPPRPRLLPASPAARLSDNNHPYRVDSLDKPELDRVKKNLAALGAGLAKVTGLRNAHVPAELEKRLRAIKGGHDPKDSQALHNAEFDRERMKVMWPHMAVLTHGGAEPETHAFRIKSTDAKEISRARRNIGTLSAHLSKIPGFSGANLAELDKRLRAIKPSQPGSGARINAEFDRVRAQLFSGRPAPGAKVQAHPYRASKVDRAETDRVKKNLALMSSGFHKLTNLGDVHDAAGLDARLKAIKPKASHGHTLDMVNHELDRERQKIITLHAPFLHHGHHGHHATAHHQSSGEVKHIPPPVPKGHRYQASSTDPKELARVRKNLADLGAGLKNLPGFGGRFDAAEHDRRMKNLKQGPTPRDTLARINAELDWERANMMQLHHKPPPRPPHAAGATGAAKKNPQASGQPAGGR